MASCFTPATSQRAVQAGRIRQRPSDNHHEREADKQECEAGKGVLEADDLVIGREDVFAVKPLRIL
jgi:hypothetical protein